MTSYNPRVRCRHGSAPPVAHCQNPVDSMMTSATRETFGEASELAYSPTSSSLRSFLAAKSQFPLTNLPQDFLWMTAVVDDHGGIVEDSQCIAVLRMAGATDISSCYDIWEATVAVNGSVPGLAILGVRFGRYVFRFPWPALGLRTYVE